MGLIEITHQKRSGFLTAGWKSSLGYRDLISTAQPYMDSLALGPIRVWVNCRLASNDGVLLKVKGKVEG